MNCSRRLTMSPKYPLARLLSGGAGQQDGQNTCTSDPATACGTSRSAGTRPFGIFTTSSRPKSTALPHLAHRPSRLRLDRYPLPGRAVVLFHPVAGPAGVPGPPVKQVRPRRALVGGGGVVPRSAGSQPCRVLPQWLLGVDERSMPEGGTVMNRSRHVVLALLIAGAAVGVIASPAGAAGGNGTSDCSQAGTERTPGGDINARRIEIGGFNGDANPGFAGPGVSPYCSGH